MRRKAVELFSCPVCSRELRLASVADEDLRTGEVREGQLACIGCGATYPVVRSMPRFVSSEEYAASFGYQWNQYERIQIDKHMHNNLSRERFDATTGWPANLQGQRILEAGCGAGRFTQLVVERGAELFAFDLSTAIEANYRNNGGAENLHIFQADIYRIPLRRESFDKIFCLGVLQHCPDVRGAFLSLVPLLRPGGEIVIDVYRKHQLLPPLKYWFRPFVRRMKTETLHALLRMTIPPLFDLKKFVYRIRAVGRPLGNLIPIGPISHKPKFDYTDEELKEIKVLSALDMLSPVHDHPQKVEDVKAWFAAVGLAEVEIKYGFNGINAKGKRSCRTDSCVRRAAESSTDSS